MKTIILAGATGGLGSEIAKNLLKENKNIQVYGLGRRASQINHPNYQHICCDMQKTKELEAVIKKLTKQINRLDAIILAAGVGLFAELEQISLEQMQHLLNVNFFSQAVLIKQCLTLLKKTKNSKIIGIGSEAAINGAKKGSIYCATKFALRGFLQSLRAECNQTNTAVTIINPGLIKTEFFQLLNFEPGPNQENYITAMQIAKTVAFILKMENNCVLEEITLQPMKKVIQKKLSTTSNKNYFAK